MSIGFNIKSPAALVPNKRVSLPFEALKPGMDFFLAIKILDYQSPRLHHLPTEDSFVYIESLLFSAATWMNWLDLGDLLQLLHQHLLLYLTLLYYGDCCFP